MHGSASCRYLATKRYEDKRGKTLVGNVYLTALHGALLRMQCMANRILQQIFLCARPESMCVCMHMRVERVCLQFYMFYASWNFPAFPRLSHEQKGGCLTVFTALLMGLGLAQRR